jgi:hypothetical protein
MRHDEIVFVFVVVKGHDEIVSLSKGMMGLLSIVDQKWYIESSINKIDYNQIDCPQTLALL